MPDLTGKKIFIAAGKNDPICSQEESVELKDFFEGAGAKVEMFWENHGHMLTYRELEAAKTWYDQIY